MTPLDIRAARLHTAGPYTADSDGYADLGDAPGLGVEIDRAALEAFRVL